MVKNTNSKGKNKKSYFFQKIKCRQRKFSKKHMIVKNLCWKTKNSLEGTKYYLKIFWKWVSQVKNMQITVNFLSNILKIKEILKKSTYCNILKMCFPRMACNRCCFVLCMFSLACTSVRPNSYYGAKLNFVKFKKNDVKLRFLTISIINIVITKSFFLPFTNLNPEFGWNCWNFSKRCVMKLNYEHATLDFENQT
jgi:hypothetical protein